MTRLIFAVLLAILFGFTEANAQKVSPTELISKGYDLYNSGLINDAKSLLINAIYDPSFKSDETSLRFALGRICFDLREYQGAIYQWNLILSIYPNSVEAEDIRIIWDVMDWSNDSIWSDYNFDRQLNLSRLFWTPKQPQLHMDSTLLIDPIIALEYLNALYEKNIEDSKRVQILYDQFFLLMGYNRNYFGFSYVSASKDAYNWGFSTIYYNKIKNNEIRPLLVSDDRLTNLLESKNLKEFYFNYAAIIADTLRGFKSGLPYYIRSQYLLGLASGGATTPLIDNRLNSKATPYFQNVINATEGDDTNPYRIFAKKWISRLK